MTFRVFVPQKLVTREAKITISPRGVFWVSPGAMRKFFDGFDRTVILYNPEKGLIGFKPTRELKNSYSISRRKGRNDATVSGKGVMECLKISYKGAKSYRATWNKKEELVQIDLSSPL